MRGSKLLGGLACFVAVVLTTVPLNAAVTSGELKSVTASSRQVSVFIASLDKTVTFRTTADTAITLDGKEAELADLEPGTRVSVFTTGSRVRKIVARTGTAPPKRPASVPKPPEKDTEEPKKPATIAAPRNVIEGAEWPQVLGPNRDGLSPERGLNFDWGPNGPTPLWSQSQLGEGYSSVAVARGNVFTLGTQGNQEAVFAMALDDGKPLWSVPLGNIYRNGAGNGPRGTPTIDGDRAYALGGHGDLVCVDVAGGREVWRKNILQEFGGGNITWGISESVLIDGDKLICTPGGNGAAMVALDKTSGQTIWKCSVPGNPAAAYSSAIAIDVGGVRQYVNITSSKLIGVRAEDGQLLWEDSSACNGTANCSTPLFSDGYLFYSTGYQTGGTLLKLTSTGEGTTAEQVYHTRDMQSHHGGMVIVDGYLYGSSEAIFRCIELETGKVAWFDRKPGKGSITYADGHLILRNEGGPITLMEANPKEYVQKAQFSQPQQFRSRRSAWAYPVVANGKLFLRDQDTLLCYDLSN